MIYQYLIKVNIIILVKHGNYVSAFKKFKSYLLVIELSVFARLS